VPRHGAVGDHGGRAATAYRKKTRKGGDESTRPSTGSIHERTAHHDSPSRVRTETSRRAHSALEPELPLRGPDPVPGLRRRRGQAAGQPGRSCGARQISADSSTRGGPLSSAGAWPPRGTRRGTAACQRAGAVASAQGLTVPAHYLK
jgi:hypothetical protein